MFEFDKFLARHGEIVAQAVLENIERYEGVRSNSAIPLEERWNLIMQGQSERRFAA